MAKTDMSDNWIEASFVEVRQPLGTFYIAAMDGLALARIAEADVHALARGKRADDPFAEWMGIQRDLSLSRVRQIADYVQASDASFPTSILVSVADEDIRIEGGRLFLRSDRRTARILDGQHRLAGLLEGQKEGFEVIATIFVDMTLEAQAHVFSTINAKQTRINPSLADNLLAFATIHTPEKVLHEITKQLNSDEGGPWHARVKMIGKKMGDGEVISQHAFIRYLTPLIYRPEHHNRIRARLQKYKGDRARLGAGRYNHEKFPLWPLYVAGHDEKLRKVLENFFNAFRAAFPDEWTGKESILTKTTGFTAMAIVLKATVAQGANQGTLSREYFDSVAQRAASNLASEGLKLDSSSFKVGEAEAKRLADIMLRRQIA